MENESVDLFNNPDFKRQFDSLPADQQKMYKDAGEYMYKKNYEETNNPQELIDNALDSLRRAFQCGLMPSQLSTDEVSFLKGIYGDTWYETFGFSSSEYTGVEKKTSSNERLTLLAHKNVFSAIISTIQKSSTPVVTNTQTTNTPTNNTQPDIATVRSGFYAGIVDTTEGCDYDNRNSGYVYSVWS